jgi:hypothetical protein
VKRNGLKDRLARYRQIKISVIGRKSGRQSRFRFGSCWRARNSSCLPVHGSDTQWYKNILCEPSIGIEARGSGAEFRSIPVTGSEAVKSIIKKFQEKYGAKDVKRYHSKRKVAVVVELV